MLGYLNRPESTAEVIDEEGWLKTGKFIYETSIGACEMLMLKHN